MRTWFEEHRAEVELLDWSSKAPDLNLMESVWGSMVNSWEPEMERTLQQLRDHTTRVWEGLRGKPDIIYNPVSPMPSRLQEVVEVVHY